MPNDLAQQLQQVVDQEAVHLRSLTEQDASRKPSASVWSKKEELGHLIDSATNNHVRFVRATLELDFSGPGYMQDEWVRLHGYQEMPWDAIIDFWQHYNHFLAGLIKRIAEDRLPARCMIGDSAPVTLKFLIEDYTLHMQHHLDHIMAREKITQYPGAAVGV